MGAGMARKGMRKRITHRGRGVPVGGRRIRGRGVPVAGGKTYPLSKRPELAAIQERADYHAPRSAWRSLLSATDAKDIYEREKGHSFAKRGRTSKGVGRKIKPLPKHILDNPRVKQAIAAAYRDNADLVMGDDDLACAARNWRSKRCQSMPEDNYYKSDLDDIGRAVRYAERKNRGRGEGVRKRRAGEGARRATHRTSRVKAGESRPQSHARSMFAKRAKRAQKLMREGHSRSSAWRIVMNETEYRKVRPKKHRGTGVVMY